MWLKQLPHLGDSSTFGCELQFVHTDTCQVLADPFGTLCRAIFVSTWLPNSALWMHYTKDTSRAKPKPFEFHPVLLIGYCLKPFLSTWTSDMSRLKQESALWVKLLGEAVSDCRWFTCQTQSSACSMERFVDATSFVL